MYRLTLFGEGDEVASDEKGAKEEDKMDIDGDDEEVVSAEGGVDVPGTSDDEEEPEVVVVDDNEFGDTTTTRQRSMPIAEVPDPSGVRLRRALLPRTLLKTSLTCCALGCVG